MMFSEIETNVSDQNVSDQERELSESGDAQEDNEASPSDTVCDVDQDDEEDEGENEDCEEESDSEVKDSEELEVESILRDHGKLICCKSPIKDYSDILPENSVRIREIAYSILDSVNVDLAPECLSSEVINCASAYASCMLDEYGEENINHAFCDLFLRKRHDILHCISMSCLNREVKGSDRKFSDLIDINSNRTPDYLELDSGRMIIIESTVTTDRGKSYMMKGKIEEGYSSKYDPEIKEMTEKGLKCNYYVFVFDVKDHTDRSYIKDIRRAADMMGTEVNETKLNDLEYMRSTFCSLHRFYGKVFSKYFSSLFSTDFMPDKVPESILKRMMAGPMREKTHYGLVTVSNSTYNRIQSSWMRIKQVLDRQERDDKLFRISLDLVSNRISFKSVDRNGLSQNDWGECLMSDDKVTLFKYLDTVVDETLVEDTGRSVEYFIPTKTVPYNRDQPLMDLCIHDNSIISNDITSKIPDFSKYVKNNVLLGQATIFEDSAYEEKIERIIGDYITEVDTEDKFNERESEYKHKKPFSYNSITNSVINKSVDEFVDRYKSLNDFNSLSRAIVKQKPSFCYPMVNMMSSKYCGYKIKPRDLILKYLKTEPGSYTKTVLGRFLRDDFEFGTTPVEAPNVISDKEREMSAIQRQMHKVQMQSKNSEGKFMSINEIPEGKEMMSKYKGLKSELKNLCQKMNYKKNMISAVRMPTRNKKVETGLGAQFSREMMHFKSKREKSTYKGVGRFDHEILSNEFMNTKRVLLSPCGVECPDRILDEHVSKDVNLMHQLKLDSLKNKSDLKDFLMGTNLYHSAAVVSRFCYTLLYFSQTSIGSDYVFGDTLGTDSFLLICKGGKKIFRTKKSKLFRMFFKTYNCTVNDYSRPGFDSSFVVKNFDGENYVQTPWMTMDETLLTDGLTFLSRSMGYCLMNVSQRGDPGTVLSENYFNIIIAMHGRRKTEEFMHNMRYLTVNCMSEVANIGKMLPSMADFNYDFFQCYLRECLLTNYKSFGCNLKKYHDSFKVRGQTDLLSECEIFHLFDPSVKIDSLELLTMVIYCTFLMSKAPVTQSLEQVKNLRNIMETHIEHKDVRSDDIWEQYEHSTATIEDDDNLSSYWSKLFKNDFIYDPKHSTMIGNFCSDYLLSRKTSSELNSKWNQIMGKNWDSMANTAGLRGDKGKDFFGKKGYYIVYNEILKNEKDLDYIMELLAGDSDDQVKRKKVSELNQTFSRKINDLNYPEAIFHVVDKRQRGGSREIYVMDYKTKINQQPIEKYMAYLCKLVPNELISIPSNKRLFHIHSNVFEKFNNHEGEVYNVVLDCRRWAPHSVINKFIDFLLGMRECLPLGFLLHCLNFFEVMFKKKVYTRKYVFDILDKNEGIGNREKSYFIEDKDVNGYYIELSYSWMMGIFNYLSSLMHVMNQMHSSQIIMRCYIKYKRQELNIHMNAHSDDSGGKLACANKIDMKNSFLVYEVLLKSSNHMLSDKKCNIGKVYFELLSILYIGNKLLSLLSKFVGSFTFHPTDCGYSMDVMESYSKCIELMSNGATFSQCYIAMKIMSYMIWRFYFGPNVPKTSYSMPPQLLGMPDAHPLNVLLSGSDSDLIRLQLSKERGESRIGIEEFVYISKYFGNFENLEDSFLVPLRCEPQIIMSRELKKLNEKVEGLSDDLAWVLGNTKQENTMMSLINYLLKLKTKNFNASLQDETLTRRISRAYYFRSSRSVVTTKGDFSYRQLNDMLSLFVLSSADFKGGSDWDQSAEEIRESMKAYVESEPDNLSYFRNLHSEILSINNSMNDIGYKDSDIITSMKTCKPVHINIQRVNTPLTHDYSSENLTAWICFENQRWLLPHSGYSDQTAMLEDFFNSKGLSIPKEQPNWLYKFLNKFKSRYLKEYHMHSNMPSGMRDISTYKDVLSFLSHNSFENQYVEGIIAPYGRTISLISQTMFQEFLTPDLKSLLNVLDLSSGSFSKPMIMDSLTSLRVNEDDCKDIFDYMKKKADSCRDKLQISNMIIPHVDYIISSQKSNGEGDKKYLKSSYFHCFLKRQHLVGNVWLGRGILYINLPSTGMKLEVEHQSIVGITFSDTEFTLTKHDVAYIDYVLQNAQLPSLKTQMKPVEVKDWMRKCFGLSDKGLYCIAECRHLTYVIKETKFSHQLSWMIKNIDNVNVEILPRLRYLMRRVDSDGIEEKIILHTFDLPVRSVLDTTHSLFNNEYNIEYTNKKGKELKDYLTDLVGESTGSERRINPIDMLNNYTISKLYSILKTLNDIGTINMKRVSYREKIYPGQEGGLLDTLMKYKDHDDNFLFNYQRLITPELMYLKSTQPDLFISNLTTNIKEKYMSLYTADDRAEIMKSMRKVVDMLSSGESEAKLIQTLTTWGYIGVMGSISNFSVSQTPEVFKMFRFIPNDLPTQTFSIRLLHQTLSSLINSFQKCEIKGLKVDDNLTIPGSTARFKMFLLSYLHSHALTCYTQKYIYNDFKQSMSNIKMYSMLDVLFSNPQFQVNLTEELSAYPILSSVPVDPENIEGFTIMLKTMINNVNSYMHQNELLDNHMKAPRLNAGTRVPTKLTEELCGGLIDFSVRRVIHNGVIEDGFYKNHMGMHTMEFNGKNITFEVKRNEGFRCRRVEINSEYILSRPFIKPDEDDEDTEDQITDITMELTSNEPDMDTIIDGMDDSILVKKCPRKTTVRYKGVVQKTDYFRVTFFNIIGCYGSDDYEGYMLNQGETLMIMADYYIKGLIIPNVDNVKVFTLRDSNWYGQTLIDKSWILIYIKDSRPIDIPVWERFLSATHIPWTELISVFHKAPFSRYNNELGVFMDMNAITNNYDALADYNERQTTAFEEMMKPKEEEELKEVEEAPTKCQALIKELEEIGVDADVINRYQDHLIGISDLNTDLKNEALLGMIKSLMSEKETISLIKGNVSDILKSKREKQFLERVFELPGMFALGTPSMSSLKNRAMKDMMVRSELESISPGLTNLILSNRLTISHKKLKLMRSQIKLCRVYAKVNRNNSKNKNFLIDLITMILNDADQIIDSTEDNVWSQIIETMSNYITTDEDDDSQTDSDSYEDKVGVGTLNYEVIG